MNNRNFFSIVLLICFFTIVYTPAYSQCRGTLIWQDEFDGTTLDLSKWSYDYGNGCPALCGWGNEELEYYTDNANNIRVTGGNLVLEARAQNIGGSSFSSGKILSRNKAYWTYGRFEARMRMPQGRGLWPAFWMLPEIGNWPTTGEIDIMEYRGDMPDRTSGTLHYGNLWPQNQWDGTDLHHSSSLVNDFNIYAVEWDANEIRWYLNDRLFKIVTRVPNSLNPPSNNANAWPWNTNFHIIFNLAVGGWFPGTTNPADVQLIKPTFEIDYVRAYDMTSAAGTQIPYNGTPAPIPGRIEAEEFDLGCDQAAYYDTDLPNNGGAFRGERVDIQPCTDAGGGYNVGWTEAGEWMEYTVNVAATGTYDLAFRIASTSADGRIRVEMDGTNITGSISFPNTYDWNNWQTSNVTNVSMTAGEHIMRIYVENGGFNLNYVHITTNTILPISLLSFSGKAKEGYNQLEWATSTEKNNDYFTLERSSDGYTWQNAGQVSAGENPDQIQEYTWIDLQATETKVYYRLRQTDYDGSFSFSEIISIRKEEVLLLIAPNPFTEEVTITIPAGTDELRLLDLTGNTLQKFHPAEQKTVTIGKTLAPGIYFLQFANGKIEKLIKQ